MHSILLQKLSANARETRNSSSLISYASCLGLDPAILAKIHSSDVRRRLKLPKNSLKPPIFGFRIFGSRSRSLMFVTPESL